MTKLSWNVIITNKSWNNKKSIKKTIEEGSKQKKEVNTWTTRNPTIWFSALAKVYEWNYFAGGICKKIWKTLNSGFECENAEVKKILELTDIEFLWTNLPVFGNCFFEVIRNKGGKIVKLVNIIATEILALEGGEWYKQEVDGSVAYFNSYTPKEFQPKRTEIFQNSGAKSDELTNKDGKGAGFNPELNEVFQFKTLSLTNKYYWDCLFDSAISQLTLLQNIDNFYNKYFEKGAVKNKIYFDKGWKLTKEDIEVLTAFFASETKGIDKAFQNVILKQWNLDSIDLTDKIDANAFLNYRLQLEKSVAFNLNVPFDLIDSINSNKATSEVAVEQFNSNTVKPLQNTILKQLKHLFQEFNGFETLQFKQIDTKNQLEEAKVQEIKVKNGIRTQNECREQDGKEPIKQEWTDELKQASGVSFSVDDKQADTIEKIALLSSKEYFEW